MRERGFKMEKTKRSRWFAVAISACALAICFALAGCGSSGSSSGTTDASSQTGQTEQSGTSQIEQSEEQGTESTTSANRSDSTVSIVSCKTDVDSDGKKAVTVTVKWTNKSDGKADFSDFYSADAYIDGEEAERTFGEGDGWFDDDKKIAVGKTQTLKLMYEWDGKSEVEVEVTNWADKDQVVANRTFKN